MKIPYFAQYILYCLFIGVVWGALDVLTGFHNTEVIEVLVVALALQWSMEKEKDSDV